MTTGCKMPPEDLQSLLRYIGPRYVLPQEEESLWLCPMKMSASNLPGPEAPAAGAELRAGHGGLAPHAGLPPSWSGHTLPYGKQGLACYYRQGWELGEAKASLGESTFFPAANQPQANKLTAGTRNCPTSLLPSPSSSWVMGCPAARPQASKLAVGTRNCPASLIPSSSSCWVTGRPAAWPQASKLAARTRNCPASLLPSSLSSWVMACPAAQELPGVVETTGRPWEGGVHSLMDTAPSMHGAHGKERCARSSSAPTTHRPMNRRAFDVEHKDEREQDQAARPGKEPGSSLETHGQGDAFCCKGLWAQPVRASTAQTDLCPLRDGHSHSQFVFSL